MSDNGFTLDELAQQLDARVAGDGGLRLTGVATLDAAGPDQLSFLANPKYKKALPSSAAGAVIVAPADVCEGKNHLVSENPYLAFARAVALFHPADHPGDGVSPRALVDPTAELGEGANVMGGAFVEAGAKVGARTVVYPGVYVGAGVTVGQDCVLYPNAVIREGCVLGDRVILQPGCVIGSDGFGYATGPRGHEKFPQIGIVRIADDVEVGAGAAIDRAALGETRVGRGTKIDNLVQLGHNVVVGEDCFLVSQVGVAGSVEIGNRVIMGGQVGVAGHLKIGDDAKIGAQAGIPSDVKPGAMLAGSPVVDYGVWLKNHGIMKRLPKLRSTVQELERRVRKLENLLAQSADKDDTGETN